MDTNLVLRAASVGNLTGDETLADQDLGPMSEPMYLHFIVPAVSAGDVLDVSAVFQDGSNNTLQTTSIPQISAAGHYVIPLFCDHPSLTDLSVVLNETDNGGPNFGAVVVYLSLSRHS